jgi:hypothetical protein
MKTRNLLCASLSAAVVGVMFASSAGAETILWTLQNATFNDGGTASGSFEYNTADGAYTDIDIVTTAGTALPGATYTAYATTSVPRDYGFGAITAPGAMALGDPLLDINSTSPAIGFETPGTVTIGAPGDFVSAEGTCNAGCTGYYPDRVLTGSVVGISVPEPTTWGLMLIGLAGLGALLRLQRKRLSAI